MLPNHQSALDDKRSIPSPLVFPKFIYSPSTQPSGLHYMCLGTRTAYCTICNPTVPGARCTAAHMQSQSSESPACPDSTVPACQTTRPVR